LLRCASSRWDEAKVQIIEAVEPLRDVPLQVGINPIGVAGVLG
jgi:hypothetical protein